MTLSSAVNQIWESSLEECGTEGAGAGGGFSPRARLIHSDSRLIKQQLTMSVACLAAERFACACCPLNERILHELIRDDEAFSSKRSGRRLNPAASCVFTLL